MASSSSRTAGSPIPVRPGTARLNATRPPMASGTTTIASRSPAEGNGASCPGGPPSAADTRSSCATPATARAAAK